MKKNVGSADKIIRFILGIGMIGAGVYYQSWWGAIGAVPIVTALLNWCPAYMIFGLSSRKGSA
jgi:hypothetical protein